MPNKQGRPLKDMTPGATAKRRKAGERIHDLRNKNAWTQPYLAEKLDISVATLRRYEKGDTDIPMRIAEEFARLTQTSPEYLFCDPDIRNYEDYLAINPMLEQLKIAYSGHWEQVATVFAFLGYRIEVEPDVTDAVRSCTDTDTPGSIVIRKVTDLRNPGNWFYCNEGEVTDICTTLRDVVSFWGYRKNLRDDIPHK